MRRRTRRVLLGAAAVPVMAIAVLGAEVQMARSAKNLPDDKPLVLDGHLDGPGVPLRMLWLGDSTAAGLGASAANQTVPRRVASALHRQVDLVSYSVSGFRLGDVLKYELARVAALHPDIVLISIGANDVVHLTSTTTFRHEYERFVQGLPDGVRLVILGVPDMGATPRFAQPLRAIAGWRGRVLDSVARSVAKSWGAIYVDIAGTTGPVMRSDTHRYFAADHYHPGDEGYTLWANAVLARLRPALATATEGVIHGHR